MIVTPTKYKFTVENLLRMEQAGVFPPDQHMELLNGEIIDMSPINPPRAHCVTRLTRFFYQHLSANDYIISIQNPIQLSSYSLPQPDVVIADFREAALRQDHIQAADIKVLIEVADSSYDYDRYIKLKEYALAGIPAYWIVNLSQLQIEVYTQPEGDRYIQSEIYQEAFDTSLGIIFSPAEILPKKA